MSTSLYGEKCILVSLRIPTTLERVVSELATSREHSVNRTVIELIERGIRSVEREKAGNVLEKMAKKEMKQVVKVSKQETIPQEVAS